MASMAKGWMPISRWREGKTTAERGYGGRWQRERKQFLSRPDNVLCRMCSDEGRITVATVVDHVIPHKGDPVLFWDHSNWQPLCKQHHDSAKQSEERGGRQRRQIGLDGWPA